MIIASIVIMLLLSYYQRMIIALIVILLLLRYYQRMIIALIVIMLILSYYQRMIIALIVIMLPALKIEQIGQVSVAVKRLLFAVFLCYVKYNQFRFIILENKPICCLCKVFHS